MPRPALLLWPAGLLVGVLAEWLGFGWTDGRHWVPDLLAGWTLISCGLLAWTRRSESAVGPLLTLTGFCWFIGNFAGITVPVIGWLAAHAAFVHRGPLVHVLLSYPTGRLKSPVDRVAVVGGYLAAGVTPAWGTEGGAIVLSTLMVLACTRAYAGAPGRLRRAKASALQGAAGLAVVLVGGAIARTVAPGDASYPSLIAYQVVLCVVAIGLLAGMLPVSQERAEVTDLVVQLDENRPGTLRDAFAWALQDPGILVGFWVPERDAFVDATGERLDLATPGPGRSVTVIEDSGRASAVVVHRRGLLDDPGLLETVSLAARLAAANASLRADVRGQVSELTRSRRRILEAGDAERRRLERRLQEGPERRLISLVDTLHDAREVAASKATAGRIADSADQLARALDALRQLAQGLHPRPLSQHGLAIALAELVVGTHPIVEIFAPTGRLPEHVERTAYFVCSEALANVSKHSEASNVRMAVVKDPEAPMVKVTVEDDGVGGAEPSRGSGLRGLIDRVEAVGGILRIASQPGRGTQLRAEIPLDGQQRSHSP